MNSSTNGSASKRKRKVFIKQRDQRVQSAKVSNKSHVQKGLSQKPPMKPTHTKSREDVEVVPKKTKVVTKMTK